jgi:uncharacterized protein (DUF2235 family)
MPTDPKNHKPKNIIICSDGTGNAGGRKNGTNVWRIREAIANATDGDDYDKPDKETCGTSKLEQVVIYEDGVGTAAFRPMMMLGGMFAIGITRNLEVLYGRLIRQFKPGDRIFMFGFSRGAFTARTLANIIHRCGIADCRNVNGQLRTPEEIDEIARNAIKAYKLRHRGEDERFRKDWGVEWPDREDLPVWGDENDTCPNLESADSDQLPGDAPLSENNKKGMPDDPKKGRFPIHFMGVWDTVDAVSLPFDNVTQILMWLSHGTSWFGFSLAPSLMLNFRTYKVLFRELDDDLHDYVKHAYHAIALDDERNTFHPLLMKEFEGGRHKAASRFVCGRTRRIEQVWFAGMHANVGGGYPKDHLAHVSLEWMMRHAVRSGLEFCDRRWEEYTNERDVLGKLHDSRSGLAAFYRYAPRTVAKSSNEVGLTARRNPDGTPRLDTFPKIHAAVFDRIDRTSRDYAPGGVPPYSSYIEVGDPTKETIHTTDAEKCMLIGKESPYYRETPQYKKDTELAKEDPNLRNDPRDDSDPLSREDFRSGTYQHSNEREEIQESVLDLTSFRRVLYYLFVLWVLAVIVVGMATKPHSLGPHLASDWWFLGTTAGIALVAAIVARCTSAKTVDGLQINAFHRSAKLVLGGALVALLLVGMRTSVVETLLWMTPDRIEPAIVGVGSNSVRFLIFGVSFYVICKLARAMQLGIREFNVYGWRRAMGSDAREPRRVIWVWLASFRRTAIGRMTGKFTDLVLAPVLTMSLFVAAFMFMIWHEVENWNMQTLTTPVQNTGVSTERFEGAPVLTLMERIKIDISQVTETGCELHKGHVYSISMRPIVGDKWEWKDDSLKIAPTKPNENPQVDSDDLSMGKKAVSMLKKDRDSAYFRLLGAIGSSTADTFPIDNDGLFTASESGTLYLFVNDLPISMGNNVGQARVTISRLMYGQRFQSNAAEPE